MILSNLRIIIDKKTGTIENLISIHNGVEIQIDSQIYKFADSFVMPGFVDSHLHFFGLGETKLMPNFSECTCEDDMIDILKTTSFRRGEWIIGFGWNQEKFKDKKFPNKIPFDKAFPQTPVYLKRIDGHCALINSKAEKLAGITNETLSPYGGEIAKDDFGNPNGILIDSAMNLIENILPFYSKTQIGEIIEISENELIKLGVTEVYDMDFYPQLYEYFVENGDNFKIRINSFVKSQNNEWEGICKLPSHTKMWNLIGLKHYADGALGSRGALLIEKYSDATTNGLELLNEFEINKRTNFALKNNLSIAIHAIGDLANRYVLKVYSQYPENDGKLRVEHCQIINSADLEYLKYGNIICSVQPIHFVSDTNSNMAQSRLGEERMTDAYRWKTLLEVGGILVAGSDAPIESPNPFFGLEAFVNSTNLGELLTIDEALNAYIQTPHKIYKQNRGEVKIGSQADLIIIDRNFKENPKSISQTNVISSIINGNFVYIKGKIK